MKHDKITNQIIQEHQQKELEKIETEIHYNNYGTRGVADLAIEYKDSVGNNVLYFHEVKSHLKQPNKVIRQYKKMVENVKKHGYQSENQPDTTRYYLTIYGSKANLKKLIEYKNLFYTISQKQKCAIRIYHSSNNHPMYFSIIQSILDNKKNVDIDFQKQRHPHIIQKLQEIVDDDLDKLQLVEN